MNNIYLFFNEFLRPIAVNAFCVTYMKPKRKQNINIVERWLFDDKTSVFQQFKTFFFLNSFSSTLCECLNLEIPPEQLIDWDSEGTFAC